MYSVYTEEKALYLASSSYRPMYADYQLLLCRNKGWDLLAIQYWVLTL